MIVQSLYSIRTSASSARHTEAYELEKRLDKWYLDLPEFLRYDPSVRKLPIPPPHVMTLVMNYWTTVLLLHRPLYVFAFLTPVSSLTEVYSRRSIHLKSQCVDLT